MFNIFVWKLKNYSVQSFKECLFFVFCFCFLLLSNNILHVMFYSYICYWNTFQYKHIIHYTNYFSWGKTIHARVNSNDIWLLFILFLCLLTFILSFRCFYFRFISWSSPPATFEVIFYTMLKACVHYFKIHYTSDLITLMNVQ